MDDRELFAAIMEYRPFDRMPVWYFGAWDETQARWVKEGLSDWSRVAEETGMDPDWEEGMWWGHDLVEIWPSSWGKKEEVLEETQTRKKVRTPLGAIIEKSKVGEVMAHIIEPALKPTRESWKEFRKRLDPREAGRWREGWEAKAKEFDRQPRVKCMLNSLFAWPRGWMGIEQISYLSYDDPALYEEIVATAADYCMELYKPLMGVVKYDFAYFFEDCCGRSGPLFSPDTYRKYYHKHYKRMVEFYHGMGVKHVLVDSDGWVDPLIECWMESGIDILFPIEVGTWEASPEKIRQQYGRELRMMGGVNKHVIPKGDEAIRRELEPLKELAAQGGFIPLPDHRIPPDCSLDQFRRYVELFKEIFNSGK